jgi:NAD(P)-dependent dehydrogenase (short-subunit alcohol dehydrogenase family)
MSSTDGKLTTVINAVGRFVAGSLADCTQDDFETAYRLNLQAVFHTCQAALPYLQKNRRGSIVNVSSILGYHNIDGVLCAAYAAAKAGLIQYTRMLAVELAPQNIRVNCVCPGVLNPIAEKMDPSNLEQMKSFRRILDQQPIKQFGNPQQIADAIIYLSGPQSAWTTGSILTIDGGMAVA